MYFYICGNMDIYCYMYGNIYMYFYICGNIYMYCSFCGNIDMYCYICGNMVVYCHISFVNLCFSIMFRMSFFYICTRFLRPHSLISPCVCLVCLRRCKVILLYVYSNQAYTGQPVSYSVFHSEVTVDYTIRDSGLYSPQQQTLFYPQLPDLTDSYHRGMGDDLFPPEVKRPVREPDSTPSSSLVHGRNVS